MNKITEALRRQFEKHRIVFWYDERNELREAFDLAGIEKIAVKNNEFAIKYLVTRQSPGQQFLIYFAYPRPADEQNWLLDLELAHYLFHTDQEAMFLQELGLDYHYKALIEEHSLFFQAKERRQKLRDFLGEGDQQTAIRYKMLAITLGVENISLETFIHAHAAAWLDGNARPDKDLERYRLEDFYWAEIRRKYNYQSRQPSIYDFLLEVFNASFTLGSPTNLTKDSRLLLSLWKDTFQFREYFKKMSGKVAADLQIEQKLNSAAIDEIIPDDLFELAEKKVIYVLVHLVSAEGISADKVAAYVKARENKFWYAGFEAMYQAIGFGAQLIAFTRKYAATAPSSFAEGVRQYTRELFEADLLYRKFIWNYRRTNQNKILAELAEKVEKVYGNDWLLVFNDNWQRVVDRLEEWPLEYGTAQRNFFNVHVKPVVDKKLRLFVIISDAFRYECGVELYRRLLTENRYEASMEHLISGLPSYTQLGMASLLPNRTLALQEDSDLVLADGQPSGGIAARAKILEQQAGVRATAIQAEDLMRMNSGKEGRDFVKQYDLIYIYHNRIDKTGDDKTSEEKVFDAVEDELVFLVELMKKINNMNGYNMLVTADHGFIYQDSALEESDFVATGYEGKVVKANRRFVLGHDLKTDQTTKAFRTAALGIASEGDVLIPKSINRLRVKGAGSRFVHGGASLQEVIVPLIKINKTRQNTTSQVDIEIIKSTDRITTNILAVSFIQSQPVSEQVLPRAIRAVVRADDEENLSDVFKYNFNFGEEMDRQREVKHRFILDQRASGKYKNQRVRLVLEEQIEGSSKWRIYDQHYYTLNISFTNDFDL